MECIHFATLFIKILLTLTFAFTNGFDKQVTLTCEIFLTEVPIFQIPEKGASQKANVHLLPWLLHHMKSCEKKIKL